MIDQITPIGRVYVPPTDQEMVARAATPRIITGPRDVSGNSVTLVSGTASFTAFTSPVTATVTQLFLASRGTAAATVTSNRLGLFTVDASGNLSLVARCASDITIANATFQANTRSFNTTGGYPASYTLMQGQRYAIGCLWVATTPPIVYGCNTSGPPGTITWLPWNSSTITGQSDLATSYTFGTLTLGVQTPFFAAF